VVVEAARAEAELEAPAAQHPSSDAAAFAITAGGAEGRFATSVKRESVEALQVATRARSGESSTCRA
jgi:hypothetical protein